MSFVPGVDHDALVALAEKNFGGLRSTYESQDVLQPCRYTGSEVSAKYIVSEPCQRIHMLIL